MDRSATSRALRAGLATVLILAAAPLAGQSLDEILARHRAARGGLDAWRAVRSLELTGTYTAFSETAPFRIVRQRPDRYRFESELGGKRVVIGHDGDVTWWVNLWYGIDFAHRMPAVDAAHVVREAAFEPPLLAPDARVELVGPGELDGAPAIVVALERPDGAREEWYLDPESGLEMASRGPVADFGREVEGWTWYSDFRPVEGIVLPFVVESEYDIRHRLMEVAEVAVNGPVDAAVFRLPAPPAMEPLARLAGTWQVSFEQRPGAERPWRQGSGRALIAGRAHGALVVEELSYAAPDGTPVALTRQWSHDRYNDRYRVTSFNDWDGHLGVFEGVLESTQEGERLVLDDLATASARPAADGAVEHRRLIVTWPESGGFVVAGESSLDGGETWVLKRRTTYVPASL